MDHLRESVARSIATRRELTLVQLHGRPRARDVAHRNRRDDQRYRSAQRVSSLSTVNAMPHVVWAVLRMKPTAADGRLSGPITVSNSIDTPWDSSMDRTHVPNASRDAGVSVKNRPR